MTNSGNDTKNNDTQRSRVDAAMRWATLTIAVIAVPSFGVVISLIAPVAGSAILVVFVLACWLCTYLGMRIMDRSSMSACITTRKENA